MNSAYYFDGKTALSHECKITLSDSVLIIQCNETITKIIWERHLLTNYTFANNKLTIKYGDFPSQTLIIEGEEAKHYFSELSKQSVIAQTNYFWLQHKLKFAIYGSIIFVVFGVLTYLFVLPYVAEKSATLIPKEAEEALGNGIYESVLKNSIQLDSATYYANVLVSKLKTTSEYDIQIAIIQSEDLNAFALPGGKIVVYSTLLKKINSYQEFSALLGHEISHVTCQHSLKSICRINASSIFISFLFGDVTGISAGVLQQADQFKQLNYSRELETQADNEGFEFLKKNNINTQGMIDLLTLLDSESDEISSYLKYLSTHPQTKERIKKIKAKTQNNAKDNEELKNLFQKIKTHL